MGSIRSYLTLAKSGIVTLVVISVGAGYAIGHSIEEPFLWSRFLVTLLSILLLASGSSALNQIQEVEIDRKMMRTANRPLPSGDLSLGAAVAFTCSCLIVGELGLAWLNSALAIYGVGAVALYNGFYTLWWKRRHPFAAIPGAIPGALPILMGHVASSGHAVSPAGLYLFAILFFWQMPHFWVLAMKYAADYGAGGIPTLPVAKGNAITLAHVAAWCITYAALPLFAPLFLPTSNMYLVVVIGTSAFILFQLHRFVRKSVEAAAGRPGALVDVTGAGEGKAWLKFFLWINFSLIVYLGAAAADLWGILLWHLWLG